MTVDENWYALRTYFSQENKVGAHLDNYQLSWFIPMHGKARNTKEGNESQAEARQPKPFVHNLIFIKQRPFETVEETAKIHDSRFLDLVAQLRETDLEFMPLGAGTCLICPECTYPDAPCRYPDKQIVSMEAAGLVVNDVCKQADIPYNHGQDTIQFSSCILY